MQREVLKQLDSATTAIKTLHLTSLMGEPINCPTGNAETCPQCITLRTYQAQQAKLNPPASVAVQEATETSGV